MTGAIATVDWEAVAAIAGFLVFIATLILAFSTWRMARAARKQANAAEDQAESASAQARASIELADIARRQLAVSSSAALGVVRREGDTSRILSPPSGSTGPDRFGHEPAWTVSLYNSGEAPAMIERPTLHLPGGLGSHGAGDTRKPALAPTEQKALSFTVTGEQVEQAVRRGGEWNLDVPYREPGSTELRRFRAALKAKKDGDDWRWIVLREETK